MSHRSGGAYRIFELPFVYEGFQNLLGARRARRRFTSEYVRPFAGATLLDVGCGPGLLFDVLPADVRYTGFDRNPRYIATAQRRYGRRGRFFCARVGDEAAAIPQHAFDFVVAKAILHHLDDVEAHHLLASARRYLKPGGVFVSTDAAFHEGQPWIARMMASLDRGGAVRTPDAYLALARPHFERVESWLVTDMLPFPYSHFIMRAVAGAAE